MKAILPAILKWLFAVQELRNFQLPAAKEILIVRQHNQLGDLIAGHSLLRALKTRFPLANITFVCSPQNRNGILFDPLVDRPFIFDKARLTDTTYRKKLREVLQTPYDITIAPATVSMSFTSNFIARLANAKVRIGPGRLESKENPYACFFNYPIALGWNEHSDRHVSDMILDIIRPFGISTDDYSPVIHISAEYEKKAAEFLDEEKYDGRQLLIGIHAGAGKPQNRWSAKNFIELIRRIREAYDPFIYLTATNADRDIVEEISHACGNGVHINMNRLVPEVAALACRSHLFISNDTGLMHVAAATPVKQLSLFGPTNPRKWAPIGKDKRFLWKGEDISAISVDDAFREVQLLLSPPR